jgi:hypothetical protein
MTENPKQNDPSAQPKESQRDQAGQDDRHEPSCFGLEEEKGESWKGTGAARPAIKDKRPTL